MSRIIFNNGLGEQYFIEQKLQAKSRINLRL